MSPPHNRTLVDRHLAQLHERHRSLERDDLAEQINERTVSRLEEMCEVLPLWGAVARQQRHDARSAVARPARRPRAPAGAH